MRHLAGILVFSFFLITVPGLQASEDAPNLNMAFGISGFAGISGMRQDVSGFEIQPGPCAGAGIVIEKMYSNRFGFRSGMEYEFSRVLFDMVQGVDEINAGWTFHKFIIPLQLITSFSTESFSLNLLAGVNYCHIFKTTMNAYPPNSLETDEDDALKYIVPDQFGASCGINLKFRFTRFTEMYAGVTGEYYFTNALDEHDDNNDVLNIIEVKIIAGWMFRTDLFPMESDE